MSADKPMSLRELSREQGRLTWAGHTASTRRRSATWTAAKCAGQKNPPQPPPTAARPPWGREVGYGVEDDMAGAFEGGAQLRGMAAQAAREAFVTTTDDTVTIAELIGEPREQTRRELCAMDAT